ncbi:MULTISPECIES: hypothetical protein [unclassified Frankia]|uniref:hypothetical protein n=1 Tax=unclassified Frankia TaxID=2632575 RepID=UPI0020253571
MTTMETQPASRVARIGLWGAPLSGKTTFLAALQIAVVNHPDNNNDDWLITGVDDTASDFLSYNTKLMSEDQLFPPATSGVMELRWRLIKPIRDSRAWWRRLRSPIVPGQAVLEIQMLDVAGRMFASTSDDSSTKSPIFAEKDELDIFDEPEPQTPRQIIDHLAECDGIVYLFDPVHERRSYRYFQRMLEQLARRSYEMGRLRDGRLPHHLAVCVTKFDDPTVYRKALNHGVVLAGDDDAGTPTVQDDYAGEFFRGLCNDRDGTSSPLVMRSIERYFQAQRVKYFVSSAIGFYIGPSRVFRGRDCANVERTPEGIPRIRGQVTPINVLEPFLWLEKQIHRSFSGT